jgi:hypothetical protein
MAEIKKKDQPIESAIKISENVTVVEKELRNDAVHKDLVTGI